MQRLTFTFFSILFFFSQSLLMAQSDKKPEHEQKSVGVGFQSSFPAYGVSVMINTNSNISIQGVLGLFSSVKAYNGRVLYRFNTEKNLQPYLYGSLGAYSYEGLTYYFMNKTETVFGFGAGGGLEYFFEGLPDLGFNLEIGIGSVKFKEIDFDYSLIWFGLGAHYYF
jgi:hypothetical protein